jgi:Uma2 family endonuclease
MTAERFLAWTEAQPDHPRYELVEGYAIAMAPETGGHARLKFQIARRLSEAVERLGLPCEVLLDGMGVQPDADHVYIPDVMIRCGAPIPDDDRIVDDPLVVIEVASPSTWRIDETVKLAGYFGIPSVRHSLIVLPGKRQVIHHERGADGVILMHLRGDGPIRLEPPGVVLSEIFPPVSASA